jgi:hypothetical protein
LKLLSIHHRVILTAVIYHLKLTGNDYCLFSNVKLIFLNFDFCRCIQFIRILLVNFRKNYQDQRLFKLLNNYFDIKLLIIDIKCLQIKTLMNMIILHIKKD